MVYFDAYNAVANGTTLALGEVGADAYASAYTEVVSGTTGGNSFAGPCVCNSADGCNEITTWTISGDSGAASGDYDTDVAAVIGM